MRELLDFTTIFLAVISMIACGDRAIWAQRLSDRRFFAVACAASFLLLICQTSWLMSFMAGLNVSPDTTNLAWDVFNSTAAGSYIYLAWISRNR